MTTKDLFLREKDARDKLAGIVSADWFAKSIAYAKAELASIPGMNSDKLEGARLFIDILCSLPNDPGEAATFTSGIQHDLDNPQPQKPKTESK